MPNDNRITDDIAPLLEENLEIRPPLCSLIFNMSDSNGQCPVA
jgi:hypothetical protein